MPAASDTAAAAAEDMVARDASEAKRPAEAADIAIGAWTGSRGCLSRAGSGWEEAGWFRPLAHRQRREAVARRTRTRAQARARKPSRRQGGGPRFRSCGWPTSREGAAWASPRDTSREKSSSSGAIAGDADVRGDGSGNAERGRLEYSSWSWRRWRRQIWHEKSMAASVCEDVGAPTPPFPGQAEAAVVVAVGGCCCWRLLLLVVADVGGGGGGGVGRWWRVVVEGQSRQASRQRLVFLEVGGPSRHIPNRNRGLGAGAPAPREHVIVGRARWRAYQRPACLGTCSVSCWGSRGTDC